MNTSKLLVFLLLMTVAGAAFAGSESGWDLAPSADIRVRQEILDGVYHFDPLEQDRDWVRIRTRAGLDLSGNGHEFSLRLTNEHTPRSRLLYQTRTADGAVYWVLTRGR